MLVPLARVASTMRNLRMMTGRMRSRVMIRIRRVGISRDMRVFDVTMIRDDSYDAILGQREIPSSLMVRYTATIMGGKSENFWFAYMVVDI